MSNEFHVVYSGKTKEHTSREKVAVTLSKVIKGDDQVKSKLLSGEPVTLKKTPNADSAKKLMESLDRLGAIVELQEVAIKKAFSEPEKKSSPQNKVNPIVQINSDAGEEIEMNGNEDSDNKVSLKNKLQYRFDSFMAKGSISTFKALMVVAVAAFLLIAGLRGLLFVLNPELAEQYENLDFFGNVYVTFLQLTDPGNMAQDILSSYWYKIFAILAGLSGIIILSALIAVITTALDQKTQELKKGHSKVIEKGHTLIIGWDEQRVLEIIKELLWANESEDDACVVILADVDKQEMDDILRLRLSDTGPTRIVTRSGSGKILTNLDLVSIEHAASVVVLASCSDTATEAEKISSDAGVIQTILACTNRSVDKEDFAIVAEVFNDAYRNIVDTTFADYVVTLDTVNILAKLLVQTSRSVGLSTVYSEILSFDGCEMYFYGANWQSKQFNELAFYFEDGVPVGVRHANGQLTINPVDYKMLDDDEILIVADDDSTIDFQDKAIIQPNKFKSLETQLDQNYEHELLIGWNHKTKIIINEFAEYVKDGSKIDIIVSNATDSEQEEILKLDKEIENIDIQLIDINPLNKDLLTQVCQNNYDNIIVLASLRDEKEVQQIDSENIVILLLLRSIFKELNKNFDNTKLITEVLESQNYPLIAQAGVKDMIISNQLVSMITAQVSQSKDIKFVYDDLFQEDGCEIYLKPMSLYFTDFPVTINFADLISVAQAREEVCFGVKLKHLEEDIEQNNGIELIPDKTKEFILNENDCIVVVAEDEL